MKYPSELLRELADKVDVTEDWVLERDWRFWRWAEAAAEAEMLRTQRDALLEDYMNLRDFAQLNHVHGDCPEPLEPSPATAQLIRFKELQRQAKDWNHRWGRMLRAFGSVGQRRVG